MVHNSLPVPISLCNQDFTATTEMCYLTIWVMLIADVTDICNGQGFMMNMRSCVSVAPECWQQ